MSEQRKLERSEWMPYFNKVTKVVRGRMVDIDVLSDEFGAQKDISRHRLLGLSYDPDDNVLEVECNEIDHLIEDPKEVYLEVEGTDLRSFMVVQSDDTRQVVRLSWADEIPA